VDEWMRGLERLFFLLFTIHRLLHSPTHPNIQTSIHPSTQNHYIRVFDLIMKLYSIPTGNFKLDGGAMFGVVPKSMWNKAYPADDNNMCTWALRCLLIETDGRLILVDNGIGNKQDDKFFGHYFLHGNDTLEGSLRKYGFTPDDITDVFLTHLHFDHCGGSIKWADAGRTKAVPAFKNATYWCNPAHWNWATNPNPREKASFLKENILPIMESGQLKMVEKEGDFLPGISTLFFYGHTEAMMLPVIDYKGTKVVFTADLFPCTVHIPLPYVMAYDVRPLETMKEKEIFLKKAAAENWVLFFEHDAKNECCRLLQTDKGVRAGETFASSDFF
jgi:glyoxylase-like metal-dependent hydrolase (beta-lactamase superfamily II)